MYCQQCGTENPEEAKFCRSCGAGLSGSSPSTQTKTVWPEMKDYSETSESAFMGNQIGSSLLLIVFSIIGIFTFADDILVLPIMFLGGGLLLLSLSIYSHQQWKNITCPAGLNEKVLLIDTPPGGAKLFLTNERLLFVGSNKTILMKIQDIETYSQKGKNLVLKVKVKVKGKGKEVKYKVQNPQHWCDVLNIVKNK